MLQLRQRKNAKDKLHVVSPQDVSIADDVLENGEFADELEIYTGVKQRGSKVNAILGYFCKGSFNISFIVLELVPCDTWTH